MKKIKEIIVVEGKSDTQKIQQAVDADTIETNGSAIDEGTLALIAKAQESRGVIVFTDPDFPGNKIRQTIQSYVPGVKHAFVNREQAQSKAKGSLGVEHASLCDIREALENARSTQVEFKIKPEISTSFLRSWGLLNQSNSREYRRLLGEELNIGYVNGKQLIKRLEMFDITEVEVDMAMKKIMNEGAGVNES